uniref:Uncharacterized protein TCIL3000_10_6440 n=1 Tax=Trypanosoma congolense (strain IL3000) TaxID=1068625 RepID=G0UWV4_TRYCI|nr:unnamed protein product [Trypanosoma congolense IL3000]
MRRSPLFEAILNRVPDVGILAVITALVGAVSLYVFVAKNRRPGSSRSRGNTASKDDRLDFLSKVRRGCFDGCVVCMSWEVLTEGGQWRAAAREALITLSTSMTVYLMCRVASEEEKRSILAMLKGIPRLVRHNILFCETAKGYEAFSRQIKPAILVTHDSAQASFLGSVLPNVVLVGSALPGSTVTNIGCVSELTC